MNKQRIVVKVKIHFTTIWYVGTFYRFYSLVGRIPIKFTSLFSQIWFIGAILLMA